MIKKFFTKALTAFFVAIIAIIQYAYAQPDTLWTRTYGGSEQDKGYSVQQTTDGGFIISGVYDYGSSNASVFLIKTDSYGDTIWTKIYGENGSPAYGNCVKQSNDSGYVIVGNLAPLNSDEGYDLWIIKPDGSPVRCLTCKNAQVPQLHNGQPAWHPNGRYIITDGQPEDQKPFTDGTNVVRLIDIEAGTSRNVVRIRNTPPFLGKRREFRVDIHPAWDRSFRWVALNACPDNTRRVYVADLSSEVL